MDIRAFVKSKSFVIIAAALAIALMVLVAFLVSLGLQDKENNAVPDNVFSVQEESNVG